jgi:hypothetical protein
LFRNAGSSNLHNGNSAHLQEGRKRRLGGRRQVGGVRKARRGVRLRIFAVSTEDGVHEVGAPPAGVLRGLGGDEEDERRDGSAGEDHAAPGKELVWQRKLWGGGVVRHFRGSGRGGGAERGGVEWTGTGRGFCRLRRVSRTPGDGGARANGGIALSALPVFRDLFFFYEVISRT